MIWASPAAWALAILAALPLVAHLWSRKRPAALPFPTLRFLRAASPVSRRLRRIRDWPLLLLRLAIVGVICAAAAGPTLSARWRRQAWQDRLHRVIVIEAGIAGASASATIAELQKTAASSTVLGPADIPDILDDAIAQAERTAGDRRTELAIVWGGSRAALTSADVADIPSRVGVRLVPVTTDSPFSAGTAATAGGVLIQTDDAVLRDTLQADVAALSLPPSTTPIRLRWHGESGANAAQSRTDCRGASALALRALDEMAADVRLRDAGDRSLPPPPKEEGGSLNADARVLARSASGEVLLRGSAEEGCLVLDSYAEPRSPLTWWSLVSAREALARVDRIAASDSWSAADAARAGRDGRAPTDSRLPGGLDTRAAWAVALVLLLVEQAWRRRGAASGARDASPLMPAEVQEPVDAA